MDFFRKVQASIYGPEYYKELPAKPFSYSIYYFLALNAILALFLTIAALFTVIPAVQSFVGTLGTKIPSYFPAELVVTVKNGTVSTNVKEPYVVPVPADLRATIQQSAESKNATYTLPQNILVIDTKDPFSLDAFKKADTLFYLTKDSLVNGSDGKITIQPLDRAGDFTVDKPTITTLVARFTPYIRVIYPVIAIGMYFVFFIGITFRLLYLFFIALIVWLISKARRTDLTYWKAYQTSIHLITLSALISVVQFAIVPQMPVPFLFTAVALIVALVNLREAPAVPTDAALPKV